MSSLIRVSVHPVQQFIAEARRVRDLINGSELIAMVMRQVVSEATQRPTLQVLIPAESNGAADPPNVVILRADEDGDDLERLATELVSAARQCWVAAIKCWLGCWMTGRFTIVPDHLEKTLDVRWVAVPRHPGEARCCPAVSATGRAQPGLTARVAP
jgi:hypothetical protein